MVATVVEMTAAKQAMISDRIVASFTCVLAQALAYQSSENPPQTATDIEALKL